MSVRRDDGHYKVYAGTSANWTDNIRQIPIGNDGRRTCLSPQRSIQGQIYCSISACTPDLVVISRHSDGYVVCLHHPDPAARGNCHQLYHAHAACGAGVFYFRGNYSDCPLAGHTRRTNRRCYYRVAQSRNRGRLRLKRLHRCRAGPWGFIVLGICSNHPPQAHENRNQRLCCT